jgi:ribosomal protein S18 acetylase RimI-like enzyme
VWHNPHGYIKIINYSGFPRKSANFMTDGTNPPVSEQISTRLAVFPDDEKFLKKLYASTREEDAAMWGMPEEQSAALVDMQYRAQKAQYDAQYPDARHEIILLEGKTVGRMMTTRSEEEVFFIDIAVLTDYRSLGIGSVIFKGLMREAEESNRPLNFSVLVSNHKAIKLYKRLGMDFVGDTGSHYLVRWEPKSANEKL